jgi:putative ABC transport system ATP-binding protein
MSTRLEARDVHVAFGDGAGSLSVLRGASLQLEPGELVVLTGPSGSGKSVLLDVLAGWSRPDSGTVCWGQHDEPPSWAGLGVVPQAMGLMPDLSVWHNITLPLRLTDGGGKAGRQALAGGSARAGILLEQLGLAHLRRRTPGELSLGEQQRVAVARAALLEPQVLLADEPSAHQDAASCDAVLDVLRGVCTAGGAVLVASHDDAVLDRSDRWLRMLEGQVVDDD